MANKPSNWSDSKTLARGILRDRPQRRKFLANLLFGVLLMMILGLWVIDGWLRESVWIFLLWWGGCAVLTSVVMMLALYDMLAVFREERGKVTNHYKR